MYLVPEFWNPFKPVSLSFDRVIQVNFNFLINQNDIVLVKKNSTSYNQIFDRVIGSPGFLIFFKLDLD